MTNDSNYDMITHIVTQQIRRFHLFYGKNIEFMQRLLTGQENGEDYEVRQVDAPRTLITPKELALIRLGELGGEDDIAQLRRNYVDTALAAIPNPSGDEVKYVLRHPLVATLTKYTRLEGGALPVTQDQYDSHDGFEITGEQADAFRDSVYALPEVRRELFRFAFEDADVAQAYEADVTGTMSRQFDEVMGLYVAGNKGLRLVRLGSVDSGTWSYAGGDSDLDYEYGRLIGVVPDAYENSEIVKPNREEVVDALYRHFESAPTDGVTKKGLDAALKPFM